MKCQILLSEKKKKKKKKKTNDINLSSALIAQRLVKLKGSEYFVIHV